MRNAIIKAIVIPVYATFWAVCVAFMCNRMGMPQLGPSYTVPPEVLLIVGTYLLVKFRPMSVEARDCLSFLVVFLVHTLSYLT